MLHDALQGLFLVLARPGLRQARRRDHYVQELADYARVIQARRRDHYVPTDAERAAVAEGIAQADRSEFVSDDQVAAVDKRRGI